MAKSCKGLAMELVKCLSETDCIKVENRSFKECAGEKSPSISSECVGLRETYFNCKRGQDHIPGERDCGFVLMAEFVHFPKTLTYLEVIEGNFLEVDMRARIRGNKGY